jgi:hypothetical protein
MSTSAAQQQTSSAATRQTRSAAVNEETQVASIFSFARNLGAAHRKTLQDSEDLHKSYTKMSDANKRVLRLEFMIGYVTGVINSQRDTAETIINGRVRFGAKPTLIKPARTKEQQQAYDAARKMFAFHIARDDARVVARVKAKQIRLSKSFKEAAVGFVGAFFEEVNAASIGEVIVMLQALKKRIGKAVAEDHSEHTKH